MNKMTGCSLFRTKFRYRFYKKLLCGIFLASCVRVGTAADGVWLADKGSGNWSDVSNWADGVIASGPDSMLILQAPVTPGTYSLMLQGDQVLGGIRQSSGDWTDRTCYKVEGGKLIFRKSDSAMPYIAMSPSKSNAAKLVISSAVEGVNGLRITGGTIGWNPEHAELSGGIELEDAGIILSNKSSLGVNNISLAGKSRIYFGHASDQSILNDFVLNGSSNSFIYGIYSESEIFNITLTGCIKEAGERASILYTTATTAPAGGRIIVAGDNDYTGDTIIRGSRFPGGQQGPVVVCVSNANGLGKGISRVAIEGDLGYHSLEISGGITIENKKMILAGPGFKGMGSLNSIGGANVWMGDVDLGTQPRATIGVAADQLTIAGIISGASDEGLFKMGNGTLKVTAENVYSTGTVIREGSMVAGHAGALGTGEVTIAASGKLVVEQGVNLSVLGLNLDGAGSCIEFCLDQPSASPEMTVTGDQKGADSCMINIVNSGSLKRGRYALMKIVGTTVVKKFVLGAIPKGLIANLEWNKGELFLIITAASINR